MPRETLRDAEPDGPCDVCPDDAKDDSGYHKAVRSVLHGLDAIGFQYQVSLVNDVVCGKAIRLYRLHLGRIATECGVRMDPERFDEACARFAPRVRKAHLDICVQRKVKSCRLGTGKADADRAAVLERFEQNTTTFHAAMQGVYVSGMREFLRACGKGFVPEKALVAAGKKFSRELAVRLAKHHAQFDTFIIKHLCGAPPKAPAKAEPRRKREAFAVRDAFGRGLLLPLEEQGRIRSAGRSVVPGVFAREFCGPILRVLKTLVFGVEKYERINERFLKSLRVFENQGKLDADRLEEFYGDDYVRDFLARTVGFALVSLKSEVRQEYFQDSVNKVLGDGGGDALHFGESHMRMLLVSWAKFVASRLDSLPRNRSLMKLLRRMGAL